MSIERIITLYDYIHGNRTIILHSRDIIQHLAKKIGDRSPANYENLIAARDYIAEQFTSLGAQPFFETYTVQGREFSNIIVEIPGKKQGRDEVIIIGAHYDTIEGTTGANDNASGIAAIIELYRILTKHPMKCTVRIVAFTLEEPPFFGTEDMGSMIHASRCTKDKRRVVLMASIDMIGFGGRFVKQSYPMEDMKDKYPSCGDFLSVAALPSYSQYAFLWKKIHNVHASKRDRILEIVAPASIDGMNLSDHMSFHKNGIPALLITDTGYYRNKGYHTDKDTEDTINYRFLSTNIKNIAHTVRDIANRKTLP